MTQHIGDTINRLTEAVERAEQRSKIITSFDYPPIPIRNYDWSAFRDGYEPGRPLGHGETEQAAVADLLEIEWEEEDTRKALDVVERDFYPGTAFPEVEEAGDLQSMLDGLAAEHERRG